jgi:hypothetical protein
MRIRSMKEALGDWMAVERNRIEVMELWPDGPRKEAGLAAARSTLESLARDMPEESSAARVIYPGMRQKAIEIPLARVHRPLHGLAA